MNSLWRTIPILEEKELKTEEARFPHEPQENILYFIEKHAHC